MSNKFKDKEYLERKSLIINNFINSTAYDFASKICSTYPYSLEYSNVNSYKEHFKQIFQIPTYPISEEEWNMIIEKINDILKTFVTQITTDDEIKRANLKEYYQSSEEETKIVHK